VLLFNGCTNELDVTAPYKDTTIVYGLLSPNDSIQYIKIYKAFLGDGNAFTFAQVADSFYFKDVLKVNLVKTKSGTENDTILLKRDTINPTADGIFAASPNIVYTTSNAINVNSTYKLVIHNSLTGSVVTSTTGIPQNAKLYRPNTNNTKVSLVADSLFKVSWRTGLNGKVYNLIIRFHFTVITDSSQTPTYIDWLAGKRISATKAANVEMNVEKESDAFYKYIGSKLSPPDSGSYRDVGKLEFIIAAGDEAFYYYNAINNVSVGVNQTIPNYTNIVNGLGLFSSKNTNSWDFELDSKSYDYLRNSPYTSDLKFY
jgi:hypothetical protein